MQEGSQNKAQDLTERIQELNKIIKATKLDEDKIKETQDAFENISQNKKETQYPITRICLTGGPCAGKTTALTDISL